jgi:hypothetical protein
VTTPPRNPLAYSSSHVCDTLAKRELKSLDADKVRAFTDELGERFIIPLAASLWRSGKITSKKLIQSSRSLAVQMGKMDSVISTEWTRLTKAASTSVEVRVEGTAAVTIGTDWLSFIVTEIHLTRRSLELATTMLPVRIHRHSLARFMERTKQPSSVMIKGILNSLKVSTVLSPAAREVGDEIAVAHENHLLLGRTVTTPGIPSTYVLRMKPEAAPYEEEVPRTAAAYDGNTTLSVDIMTFIDSDNLSPSRTHLRDILRQFQDDHTVGVNFLYAARELYGAMLPTAEMDDAVQRGVAASRAAKEVVATPEWKLWLERKQN